ncbi:hypothetical protein Pcinc_026525 [Petrolisthes cinctipes]|uniref:Uncharacterized protein n=1 Tax=Petrolisthes cinctipes TaxID=88211 RepID=A0AAE1F5S7_PETCI|nr:hypothetical protein Pcinc_026525 [Petrolisthes cinctipes]
MRTVKKKDVEDKGVGISVGREDEEGDKMRTGRRVWSHGKVKGKFAAHLPKARACVAFLARASRATQGLTLTLPLLTV